MAKFRTSTTEPDHGLDGLEGWGEQFGTTGAWAAHGLVHLQSGEDVAFAKSSECALGLVSLRESKTWHVYYTRCQMLQQ